MTASKATNVVFRPVRLRRFFVTFNVVVFRCFRRRPGFRHFILRFRCRFASFDVFVFVSFDVVVFFVAFNVNFFASFDVVVFLSVSTSSFFQLSKSFFVFYDVVESDEKRRRGKRRNNENVESDEKTISKATKKDYVEATLPRYEIHIVFQIGTVFQGINGLPQEQLPHSGEG